MKEPNKNKINEGQLKVACLNLEAKSLKDYAVSKILGDGEYGNLGAGAIESALSQTPDEQTYQTLMAPALANDIGLNKEYIKKTSINILMESLSILPLEKVLKYLGAKINLAKEYLGKNLQELGEKANILISAYFNKIAEDSLMNSILPSRAKQRTKSLEDIFAQKEPQTA